MSRVLELLGPSGPLARSLRGYEHRPSQLEMAEAVEHALEHAELLVCEAGTGTGKTLAYLVPAILSKQKVVVSTATKALQDQIVGQDLPAIERHLALHPSVALVKGLSNYLCLRRFDEFRKSGEACDPSSAGSLARIEEWLRETETGEISELAWLPEGDPIWNEVCSSTDTRKGAKCAWYRDCFITKMRRRADDARIVVANHHLVFADLALREGSDDQGGVLPDYEALILDEAHQIEDIASDFFGVRVSTSRVEALLRDTDRSLRLAGVADPLFGGAAGSKTELVRRALRDVFDELVFRVGNGEHGKKPLPRDLWAGGLLDRYHRLDASLEALEALATKHNRDDAVQGIARRVSEVRTDLADVVEARSHAVTWLESRLRSASIGATPIEVASILRSRVIERTPSVVMTSATLTTAGSFEFFRSRVGADSTQLPIREVCVSSPFDYEKSAILYTARDLPDPKDGAFFQRAAERSAELVRITKGGALVLCTSFRSVGVFREVLTASIDRPIMVQGDAPKGVLLERFRATGNGVLVATMSFWEGVDVAGDALRLVIIDKIPFAVPTDPVVMARCAKLEEAGENPFVRYQIPEAAITLKQGFGRLIRTKRDRGIVAVLDRRLVQRGYGKTLLASLPPARRLDSMAELAARWAEMHRAKPAG